MKLLPILTVTLNPAIDQMVLVPHFVVGKDNRALRVTSTAGGKGLNVARTLKGLGAQTVATGFAGGATGQNLLRELLLEGIEHNFVFIQGETRVNLTVGDQKTKKQTRLLEPGPVVDKTDLASFWRKFQRLAEKSQWIVVSGRGIQGAPKDFYGELTQTGQKAGGKVFVDTSGKDFQAALKGKPFLVKPNKNEAEVFLKSKLSSRKDIKTALKKLLNRGAQNVIISLGRRGAAGTDGKVFCFATVPPVKVVNPVGCGDALLAGCVYAFSQQSRFKDVLAFGAACGTASALTAVPGHIEGARLGGILQQVIVKDF